VRRQPPKNGKAQKYLNTLLVDGNALFKTGFHGAKHDYNANGQHVGGISQFIAVIRKLLIEDLYHRVFVFWDGTLSGKLRYEFYPDYKSKRNKDYINGTRPDDESLIRQRNRVHQYLEELFIRQITDEDVVESDDYIAFFCKTKKDYEKITIITNDSDISQLVNEDVRIYDCKKKHYVTNYNYQEIYGFHLENAAVVKAIVGDTADSITGVKGVGEKTLLKLFPDLQNKPVSLQQIIDKAKELQQERLDAKKKPLAALTNLIEGNTTDMEGNVVTLGDKLYERNMKLVDLSIPMITEDAIGVLGDLREGIDPEDRGIKNAYRMFKEDGIDIKLGSTGIEYFLPFKKLSEREKKYHAKLLTEAEQVEEDNQD
jgi:5'-3' exonuclease